MAGAAQPHIVLPAQGSVSALRELGNLPPFGALQLGFAAALSRQLSTDPAARRHPELVALGYWLRAAHLQRLVQAFAAAHAGQLHLPRGLVFHVAPANVDTIFVYSWLVSLLCGNRNLIRLSSRESAQTTTLLAVLGRVLAAPEWHEVAARTLVLRYGHEAEISAELSAHCDMRVVWGGDASVRALRAFALPPHATELAFANKLSLCVLQADAVAGASDEALAKLAKAFHNDAYWFGQMACSSPRLVFWVGAAGPVSQAAARFWPALRQELDARGAQIAAADSLNKEVAVDSLAIELDGVRVTADDPRTTRAWMAQPALRDDLHCGAGLFHEARIGSLAELLPHLTRKVQTISHHGFETAAWQDFLRSALPAGIDRIVPVGEALDFAPVWDGFDLFASFLRQVTVR
ncbi:MAG: acyl-CoA reductase [Rubrivivax sp.]